MTTNINVCGWCGKETIGEFCSAECREACMDAYVQDMAEIDNSIPINLDEIETEEVAYLSFLLTTKLIEEK